MNIGKMKEVFADEAFVKGLFELETAAEVQAALKEKGLEMTEEEILGVRDLLIKVGNGEISAEKLELWTKQVENGELSDEMLEQVAGGAIVTVITTTMIGLGTVLKWFGIGTAIGAAAVGATVGTIDAVERRW